MENKIRASERLSVPPIPRISMLMRRGEAPRVEKNKSERRHVARGQHLLNIAQGVRGGGSRECLSALILFSIYCLGFGFCMSSGFLTPRSNTVGTCAKMATCTHPRTHVLMRPTRHASDRYIQNVTRRSEHAQTARVSVSSKFEFKEKPALV